MSRYALDGNELGGFSGARFVGIVFRKSDDDKFLTIMCHRRSKYSMSNGSKCLNRKVDPEETQIEQKRDLLGRIRATLKRGTFIKSFSFTMSKV